MFISVKTEYSNNTAININLISSIIFDEDEQTSDVYVGDQMYQLDKEDTDRLRNVLIMNGALQRG